jgi:hypothetical protein
MQYKDARQFRIDLMDGYKNMMIPLYQKYKQYSNISVKIETLSILTAHILSSAKQNERKRAHRKLRFKSLKAELKETSTSLLTNRVPVGLVAWTAIGLSETKRVKRLLN